MICGFDLVVLQGGLLCGAVLAVIMPCFVVLWVCFFFFFFFFLLWTSGDGGCGCG